MSVISTRALAAIFCITPFSSVYADIVKIEFQGTIDSSDFASYADLAVGSAVQGSLVYDPDWDIYFADEMSGQSSGPTLLQLKSGNSVFSSIDSEIFLTNDWQLLGAGPYRDGITFVQAFAFDDSPQVPDSCSKGCPLFAAGLQIGFGISDDTPPSFLTSVALPKATDWPATGLDGYFRLRWSDGGELNYEVEGSIGSYSVSAVPEPGEWAFMLSGLGLAAFVLRKRARP